MNYTYHRWYLGTLCDDIFRDVEQLPRMSIHGTHGRVRTLDRLRRSVGYHARRDEYRIHRMRGICLEILTGEESRTDTPSRQYYPLVDVYIFPCGLVYLFRRDWIFLFYVLLAYR